MLLYSNKMLIDDNYVVTDRGGIIENRHAVHVAVTDSDGKLLYSIGNPRRITLARSAAKPAQALAVLETGAVDTYGFDAADLALMCASHSSEDSHLSRASSMLNRVGATETQLRCGGHPAISEVVNRSWIKRDYIPTAICNNCSGKHVGMIGGSNALKADVEDYHLPSHPMQLRVKQVMEDLCGLEERQILWGIDGCNLPAPAVPLLHMSKLYAKFADAADAVRQDQTAAAQRSQYMARVFQAMTTYPEMIGGDARFCTDLMRVFQGNLIGKIGADALYCVGIRASEQTRRLGADGSVGVSIKIEDGNIEILYAVVVEILKQLEIGSPREWEALSRFHRLERRNTMGVVTGLVSLTCKLQAAKGEVINGSSTGVPGQEKNGINIEALAC